MIEMICWCGEHYFAREADLKRGWGLSCCKSHAAKRRKYGKPKAVRVDGIKVKKTKKKPSGKRPNDTRYDQRERELEESRDYWEEYLDELHPFSAEALGQW